MSNLRQRRRNATWAVVSLLLASGCAQEMMNQRRVEPQELAEMFADGVASRPIPEHAIAASAAALGSVSVGQSPAGPHTRWSARTEGDEAYWQGRRDGRLVDEVPEQALARFESDGQSQEAFRKLLERGHERFDVSCAPCHDRTGSGNGMVARRGYKYPPSYHTDRLRSQPLGYIFNVATNGRGEMPSYGDFISIDDRWAIAAYVRTLQFSQYVSESELSDADRDKLEAQQHQMQQDRRPPGDSAAGGDST